MKRIISILLASCMAVAVICMGATPAVAAGTDEIVAAIEAYNLYHGGEGSLIATITGEGEVTVTGSVTGATKGLLIGAEDVEVHWKATLTGDCAGSDLLTALTGLRIYEGALIQNESGGAIYGIWITILGGRIIGDVSGSHNGVGYIIVADGTVAGDMLGYGGINVEGGMVTGFLDGQKGGVYLAGGTVNATGFRSTEWGLIIERGTTVNVSDNANIETPFVYIEPGAVVNNFPKTGYIKAEHFDYINAASWQFTVIGDVTLNFTLWLGGTLTIPKDASLRVDGLILDGGVVVIDGVFSCGDSASSELRSGIIKGKNAGCLAGIYGSSLWDRLPCFIQRPLFNLLVCLHLDDLVLQALR